MRLEGNVKTGPVSGLTPCYVAFSADGKKFASANERGFIYLWDMQTGKRINEITLDVKTDKPIKTRFVNQHVFTSVVFSQNGKTLANGNHDNTVRTWDAHTGDPLLKLDKHKGNVYCVAFSPDGKTLASCGADNTMRFWDAVSGELIRTLKAHGYISSIAFSPDGKTLASDGGNHTVMLWEVSTGKHLRTLKGHQGSVESVAFSPDGKTLASGSGDGTMLL